MAAKIRLKRVGRKGQPSYRVVVLDGQKPRDAKVVADLGFYDPKTNPPTFEVDSETALKWLLDGAKATSAARSVLSKAGVMAAWDAAKRGETIAITTKELKPSTKRKKKDEPPVEEEKVEESTESTEDAAEEPTEEPAKETEEAAEPAAEEDAAPEQDAAPEEDAADEAPDEAPESEDEEAAEPEVDAEESSEEEPEAEEPANDVEEEAKEAA